MVEHKSSGRKRFTSLDELAEGWVYMKDPSPFHSHNPEQMLIERDTELEAQERIVEFLQLLMSRLKPKTQETCYVMLRIPSASIAEISAVTCNSQRTTYRHLRKIRKEADTLLSTSDHSELQVLAKVWARMKGVV